MYAGTLLAGEAALVVGPLGQTRSLFMATSLMIL
jgi:hypothetical protein